MAHPSRVGLAIFELSDSDSPEEPIKVSRKPHGAFVLSNPESEDESSPVRSRGSGKSGRPQQSIVIDLTSSPSPSPQSVRSPTRSTVENRSPKVVQKSSGQSLGRESPSFAVPPNQSPLDDISKPEPRISPPSGTKSQTSPQRLVRVSYQDGMASNSTLYSNNEADDIVMEDAFPIGNQHLGASPTTPSRRSSRSRNSPAKNQKLDVSPSLPSGQSSRGRPRSPSNLDSPPLLAHRTRRGVEPPQNTAASCNEAPGEVMAQQNVPSEQPDRQWPTAENLEELLRGFQQDVYDDHAETVRWLLHDAKNATCKRQETQILDKVSPFAHMKGLQTDPDDTYTVELECHVSFTLLQSKNTILTKAYRLKARRKVVFMSKRKLLPVIHLEYRLITSIPFLNEAYLQRMTKS
jgi:hypothetical protein